MVIIFGQKYSNLTHEAVILLSESGVIPFPAEPIFNSGFFK